MGKKKTKAEVKAVYLAPPTNTQDVRDNALDYDPKTKVADEFEQDLDFLLADEYSETIDILGDKLGLLSIEKVKKGGKNADNGKVEARSSPTPVVTKKIRREILDFDITFSDDDDDDEDDEQEQNGNNGKKIIPQASKLPKPTDKSVSKTKAKSNTPKTKTKTKTKANGNANGDQFKNAEDYFKKEMGLSDSEDDDSDITVNHSDKDELEEDFQFQFVVSDEEEQIQLDEQYNNDPQQGNGLVNHSEEADKKKKRRILNKNKNKKKNKQLESKTVHDPVQTDQATKTQPHPKKPKKPTKAISTQDQTGNQPKDGPKPLTRTSLLNHRKTKEENETKQKAKGPKAKPESPDTSTLEKKPKRKPPRRAPTALKETTMVR